jgi:TonB family protein
MTDAPVTPRPWPWRRWGVVVAFVFCVQLGLIFSLSDRSVAIPRPRGAVPSLHLAGKGAGELLALSDPTLFALPHRQGFAGLAWLRLPQPEFHFFHWPQEPRFLQPSVERLGTVLDRGAQPESLTPPLGLSRPEPTLTMAEADPRPTAPAGSRLRLEDGLAGRRLVTPINVPPMPHTDLLTDTVVQVVANAKGLPVSVPVLLSSSGSAEADREALRLARSARFVPVTSGGPEGVSNLSAQLTWGRMIFEWQTSPMPTTNAPAAGGQAK